jgi:hypothetical protein
MRLLQRSWKKCEFIPTDESKPKPRVEVAFRSIKNMHMDKYLILIVPEYKFPLIENDSQIKTYPMIPQGINFTITTNLQSQNNAKSIQLDKNISYSNHK